MQVRCGMENNLIIKPKKIKGEDGFKTFSIRIREDTVSRIDKISSETNRSRNELIGLLLEYALERCIVEKEDQRVPLSRQWKK